MTNLSEYLFQEPGFVQSLQTYHSSSCDKSMVVWPVTDELPGWVVFSDPSELSRVDFDLLPELQWCLRSSDLSRVLLSIKGQLFDIPGDSSGYSSCLGTLAPAISELVDYITGASQGDFVTLDFRVDPLTMCFEVLKTFESSDDLGVYSGDISSLYQTSFLTFRPSVTLPNFI